jgi:hypothetical protein
MNSEFLLSSLLFCLKTACGANSEVGVYEDINSERDWNRVRKHLTIAGVDQKGSNASAKH